MDCLLIVIDRGSYIKVIGALVILLVDCKSMEINFVVFGGFLKNEVSFFLL